MAATRLPRRAFLKGGGALVVTFAFGPPVARAAGAGDAFATPPADAVASYLAVGADGRVTLYSGKVEIGTGALTALMQIAAEELAVAFDRMRAVQGDTARTPDQGPTYASLSIQAGGAQIRQAAATARAALLAAAGRRLGVPVPELVVASGVVRGGGRAVTYGELVAGRTLALPVDPAAPLTAPRDFRIVGQPVPRIDIPAKVFGTFEFVQDVRVPGMVHARVVHPAAFGARLLAYSDAACRAIPGYLRAVAIGNLLAVVARDEWAAIRAARAIVAQWSAGSGLPVAADLFDHVRHSAIARDEVVQSTGDVATAMQAPGRELAATYTFAMNTHGSIGPSCAVASYRGGRLTVWTPAQGPHLLQAQLATMMELPRERVRCIFVEGAGCYGRNGADDCASEAALIARAVGRPVRLQWMRQDEHGWDPKGPPVLLDYRARVDADGAIRAWDADAFMPERPMRRSGVTLLGAMLADKPKYGPADAATPNMGLGIPYALPASRLSVRWLVDTPLPAAWIRAPGRMQNTFGNECFLDEIGALAGADPFAFRRRYLTDPRGLELLARLEAVSLWQPRTPGARGGGPVLRGRGVAYVKYELVRTYVGVVADVVVDRATGVVTVERVFVAHDCGRIVNPDGLYNQIEGNVVQATSRALVEKLTFSTSAVTSLDWATYPILEFPAVPAVNIELINRPDEEPWGAGEPTTAVVPAAIANAIYDAAGIRVRTLPITPDVVLAALAATPRPAARPS